MSKMKALAAVSTGLFLFAAILAGCQSHEQSPATQPLAESSPAVALPTIRIKAGVTTPYKDPDGNVWLADQGFADGDTVARDDNLAITGTNDPALYRTERYGMTLFTQPLPNGKYIVKLHFADTYSEGITAAGMRVFSFNVQGHDFKDLDLFAKVGTCHAYVETVPVDITDGKLTITFTANVENPEINGIEILPAS